MLASVWDPASALKNWLYLSALNEACFGVKWDLICGSLELKWSQRNNCAGCSQGFWGQAGMGLALWLDYTPLPAATLFLPNCSPSAFPGLPLSLWPSGSHSRPLTMTCESPFFPLSRSFCGSKSVCSCVSLPIPVFLSSLCVLCALWLSSFIPSFIPSFHDHDQCPCLV